MEKRRWCEQTQITGMVYLYHNSRLVMRRSCSNLNSYRMSLNTPALVTCIPTIASEQCLTTSPKNNLKDIENSWPVETDAVIEFSCNGKGRIRK